MKCGQLHISHECKKARDTVPTCTNYGGPHLSNFRGCRFTLQARPAQQVIPEQQPRAEAAGPAERKPNPRDEGGSYAQVAAKFSRQNSIKDALHVHPCEV